MPGDRTRARQLAAEYIGKGDPTGWFEQLYREGYAGQSVIPWADRGPNRWLLQFWKEHPLPSSNKRALVIACGLGDDAEQLSAWGFATTAFDVSETAIRMARERFPSTAVSYSAANLLEPPPEWRQKFDFIFEANTVQALPLQIRSEAIRHIASLLAPGGHLLAIARGRQPHEALGELPWPLSREEMMEYTRAGLTQARFEEFFDEETPPARRFLGLFTRSAE